MSDLDDLFMPSRRYGRAYKTLKEVMDDEENIERDFPYVAHYTYVYGNPGEVAGEQLRLLRWLHSHNQENHRDYLVEKTMIMKSLTYEYRFRDPKVAMMFKLSFI